MKSFGFCAVLLVLGTAFMSSCTSEVDSDVIAVDSAATAVDTVALTEEQRLEDINARIRLDINNPELYYERANYLVEQVKAGGFSSSHVDLAVNDLKRALGIDSTVAKYHYKLGNIYYDMNAPVEAMVAYESAVSFDDQLADAYLQMGRIYFVYKEYQKALTAFDNALQADQLLADAYYMKGWVFKEAGDTVRAVSSFETAREMNPDYYEASLELGFLYASADDLTAIQYYDAALVARPGSIEALYAKGLFCQQHDSIEAAMTAYFDILALEPYHHDATYNIGYTYLVYVQDFDSAAFYFDKVLSQAPSDANALYNRGYAAELNGEMAVAEEKYRAALVARPDFDLPALGLSRLGR